MEKYALKAVVSCFEPLIIVLMALELCVDCAFLTNPTLVSSERFLSAQKKEQFITI